MTWFQRLDYLNRTFTCPRRHAEGRAGNNSPFVSDGPNKDTWRKERDGLHTCSYDGSLHPDDFMAFVRTGAVIGSTDKSYKFYVHAADASVRGAGKFYTHHLSPEQSAEFYRLWLRGAIDFGGSPPYVRIYLPGLGSEMAAAIKAEEETE